MSPNVTRDDPGRRRCAYWRPAVHQTLWEPLTYTFAYLTALCLLTAVVTGVGLLLYLESQTPARRRAYLLLRRMGLRPASHRLVLLAELGVPLALGALVGFGLCAGLVLALHNGFETNPDAPPGTVLDLPWRPAATVVLGLVVVCLAAASYLHARVVRANPAEPLRHQP